MSDIELRFVERDERTQVETYVAFVRKIQILQYRNYIRDGTHDYWGEWTDVPMGIEEKEQPKANTNMVLDPELAKSFYMDKDGNVGIGSPERRKEK
jgi:hypothetical protein